MNLISGSRAIPLEQDLVRRSWINGTPITSAAEQLGMAGFKAKAYPNPFTSETTIEYNLPESGDVEVSIYDLTGRKIAALFAGRQAHGEHQIQWVPGRKVLLHRR